LKAVNCSKASSVKDQRRSDSILGVMAKSFLADQWREGRGESVKLRLIPTPLFTSTDLLSFLYLHPTEIPLSSH
jgi:hypothetical protein